MTAEIYISGWLFFTVVDFIWLWTAPEKAYSADILSVMVLPVAWPLLIILVPLFILMAVIEWIGQLLAGIVNKSKGGR